MKIKFWAVVAGAGVLAAIWETSFWPVPMVVWWWWWVSRRVSYKELIWISVVMGVVMDSLRVRPLGWTSLILLGLTAALWWLREKVGREQIEWGVMVMVALFWSGLGGWGWGVGKMIMVILVTIIELVLVDRLGDYSAIKLKR